MVRVDAVTEDFLTDKGKGQGGKSGNYRSDASRELDRFVEFLAQHEDAVTMYLMSASSICHAHPQHSFQPVSGCSKKTTLPLTPSSQHHPHTIRNKVT